jgi:phosphotransferase system HPr (HPr) family protein
MLPTDRRADPAGILVVDDDRDTAEGMATVLRLLGHDAEFALDGNQAIELARRLRPRCVLLDISMPGLDGYQVASRLREELPGPLVLIAILGYGREEDRRRSRASGFDHHFIKPLQQDAWDTLLSLLQAGTPEWTPAPDALAVPTGSETAVATATVAGERGECNVGDDRDTCTATTATAPRRAVDPTLPSRQSVQIINDRGLHLRAAEKLVRLARLFQSDLQIDYDGHTVNCQSILDLMTLAAPCGATLKVEARGLDAEAALGAAIDLIGCGFDELCAFDLSTSRVKA